MSITWEEFEKVDIRVGRVIEVLDFPEGKYSSHILKIDFGAEIGVKKSLARLKPNYIGPELMGRQVLAVVILNQNKSDSILLRFSP